MLSKLYFIPALLHVLIFAFESLFFKYPKIHHLFSVRTNEVATVRSWAFNQGFYNLFLAIGIFVGHYLLTKIETEAIGEALINFCFATPRPNPTTAEPRFAITVKANAFHKLRPEDRQTKKASTIKLRTTRIKKFLYASAVEASTHAPGQPALAAALIENKNTKGRTTNLQSLVFKFMEPMVSHSIQTV